MKNQKLDLIHILSFLLLIIFSLIFFCYTNQVVFEEVNKEIIDCSYNTLGLIANSLILIISIAIIEISIMAIKKLPKDKNDYNKALIISNIIIGTILNLFIIFWPIAEYLLKCN